jgi:hypothetical protein
MEGGNRPAFSVSATSLSPHGGRLNTVPTSENTPFVGTSLNREGPVRRAAPALPATLVSDVTPAFLGLAL